MKMRTKTRTTRTKKKVITEKQSTGRGGRVAAQVQRRGLKDRRWWSRSLCRAALIPYLLLSFFLYSPSLFAGKDKDLTKHYGLIYGTAYGPDDRPMYGAKIEIHPVGQKHPHWELMSDHQGEFALRVPPGPGDYLITGEAVIVEQNKQKKKLKAEKTVHIQSEERRDIGLHLAE